MPATALHIQPGRWNEWTSKTSLPSFDVFKPTDLSDPVKTVTTVLVLLVAVIPGAVFIWNYERVRQRMGGIDVEGERLPPGERLLLFVLVTVIYHLVIGWGEYWLWRHNFPPKAQLTNSRFALLWGALGVPMVVMWQLGRLTGRVFPLRQKDGDAWQASLANFTTGYLRVTTVDGAIRAGRWGPQSAADVGARRDLYLEEAYDVLSDGNLGQPLGYRLFIPGDSVQVVAFIPAKK